MTCPDRDELIVFREHELSERRAAEIRAHLASCPACRDRLAALTRLVDDVRAPLAPAAPSPDAVARVMRRLDAPPASRRVWPQLGLAVVAAAAVAVAVIAWPARDHDRFTARGGRDALAPGHVTAEAIEREVGTTLFALRSRAEPLAAGARVTPSTAFVLGYRNLSHAVPLFALAFAIDARQDIHWLYPGFTAAGADPAAVPLTASDTTRLMSESVVLDGIAAGPLRVVVLISADRLQVSAIERLRGDQLTRAALQQRFPLAAITEQHLEVSP